MINVFLDLEETVIDDWFSCDFLIENIKNIKSIINHFSIKFQNQIAFKENINLILFSAAVINEKDLDIFNKSIKSTLEKELGFNFKSEFLFSNENIRLLSEKNGIRMLEKDHVSDIFTINIKEQIFKLIAVEGEVNILFDDTVDENSIETTFKDSFFNKERTIKICVKV